MREGRPLLSRSRPPHRHCAYRSYPELTAPVRRTFTCQRGLSDLLGAVSASACRLICDCKSAFANCLTQRSLLRVRARGLRCQGPSRPDAMTRPPGAHAVDLASSGQGPWWRSVLAGHHSERGSFYLPPSAYDAREEDGARSPARCAAALTPQPNRRCINTTRGTAVLVPRPALPPATASERLRDRPAQLAPSHRPRSSQLAQIEAARTAPEAPLRRLIHHLRQTVLFERRSAPFALTSNLAYLTAPFTGVPGVLRRRSECLFAAAGNDL